MTWDLTSTTALSDADQIRYDNRFLQLMKETIVMDQVIEKRKLPRAHGKVVDMIRYINPGFAEGALTEGTIPTESNMTMQNVQATIKEVGDWYKPSTLLKAISRDRELRNYIEVAGVQAAETYDIRNMAQACLEGGYPIRADNDTTNWVFNSAITTGGTDDCIVTDLPTGGDDNDFVGGHVIFTAPAGPNYAFGNVISDHTAATKKIFMGGDASTHISMWPNATEYPSLLEETITTADEIRVVGTHDLLVTDIITSTNILLALTALRDNHAMPLKGGYYVGIVDPYVAADLMRDTDWKNVQTYKDQTMGIFKGEIGQLWGIRWIMTTQPWRHAVDGYQYSASGLVHCVPIFGRQALAAIDLEGQGKHLIVITDDSKSDPLRQYITVGWKFIHAARTMNAFFSSLLLVGATGS
jgi:hypothetical protein